MSTTTTMRAAMEDQQSPRSNLNRTADVKRKKGSPSLLEIVKMNQMRLSGSPRGDLIGNDPERIASLNFNVTGEYQPILNMHNHKIGQEVDF